MKQNLIDAVENLQALVEDSPGITVATVMLHEIQPDQAMEVLETFPEATSIGASAAAGDEIISMAIKDVRISLWIKGELAARAVHVKPPTPVADRIFAAAGVKL